MMYKLIVYHSITYVRVCTSMYIYIYNIQWTVKQIPPGEFLVITGDPGHY